MVMRGVIASVLMAGMLCARAPEDRTTKELLEALFSGLETPKPSYFAVYGFDLELLLGNSKELEEQYATLSSEEKESLIETIEDLNEAIAEALASLDDELEE